jgi:hypothetical protein
MPPEEFEPMTPAIERLDTYALDRKAIGTGFKLLLHTIQSNTFVTGKLLHKHTFHQNI